MKVSIVVGGTFHSFQLAAQLERWGILEKLVTTHYPLRGEDIPREKIRQNLIFEVIGRTRRILPRADYYKSQAFSRWASKDYGNPDILVGWAGFALESFQNTKAIKVLERSSAHVIVQQKLTGELYDIEMVKKMLWEYNIADYICVPSKFAAKTFYDRGFSKDKIKIIPLGVDAVMFSPGYDVKHGDRVVAVGAGNRKGTQYLHVAAQGQPWKVYVATNVPFRDMPELYRQADVFVLPSLEEGFSLALLEAMASGLPCVATLNSAGPDLIQDKVNGRIVPARDPYAIREAVDDCFAHVKEYGKAARQTALANSWDNYGNKVVMVYESMGKFDLTPMGS